MKTLRIISCIILALASTGAEAADMKFFKKAAKYVWGVNSEMFDARREIPDSIASANSAVILMKYQNLFADYEKISNIGGDKTFTRRKSFTRIMVKLMDQNGVKEFSQHEFGESERAKAGHYTYMKADNAFGARVHKPDGTVSDVDLSQAFAVTEGKKGNEKNAIKRKIDIPGLEPGDVLEFFVYDEDEVQELDPSPITIGLVSQYPTLESVIECRFAPGITVEYRAYNGAPDFEKSTDDKGYNCLRLQRFNVPVLTDKILLRKARQLPFYKFYTLNNTSKIRFYPFTRRSGGVNGNLPIGSVYRDISATLAKSEYGAHHLPGDIRRHVKNFIKNNPEASREDILKAAWTSAVYVNRFDEKDSASDFWVALMFADVARKQGWADSVGVGFLNSCLDVPTEGIINWRQPDFGVFADGKFYHESSTYSFPADETPFIYQGQRGGAYTQDRENLERFRLPKIFTTATTPSGKSRMSISCDLRIDEENGAEAVYSVVLTGITKEFVTDLTDAAEWAAEIEDYLGIPQNKRYKPVSYDAIGRKKEIEESVKTLADEHLYYGEDYEISDISIENRGVRPDSPVFKMTLKTKMTEMASNMGNDILVPAGRFIGRSKPITGTDLQRQTDLDLFGPLQSHTDINIAIPDGYEADQASLENLKTLVNNPLGMFYAEAVDNGDGSVSVRVRNKINVANAPIGAWEDFLKLHEAQTTFTDAVILFRKK